MSIRKAKPMLAVAGDTPFDRSGWLFEIKWDGYRCLADVHAGEVQLYSRQGLSYANLYRPVEAELAKLGQDALLDGEIVVLDERGRSRFHLLQNYQKTGQGRLVYYVFDLLRLNSEDLRSLPLTERKLRLQAILPSSTHVRMSEHVEERGVAFFQAAVAQGLEGIMAKRASSQYLEGRRSPNWVKLKGRQRQEAVIAGFTQPRGQRKDFGALVLGVYEHGELIHVGHAGSGFTTASLQEVRERLQPLLRPDCPFRVRPESSMPVKWVEPSLVCEVEFQEWTEDGIMRHPTFLGLRFDKPARQVQRERPSPAASPSLPEPTLTNLTKIYWPDEEITKGELLDYYREVAPFILPYLKDRPMSMHRHPNGILGKSFYQKDVTRQPPPDWVRTTMIASDSTQESSKQIVCQDAATLLYLANLGCIEMNPWHSRLESLSRPDYLILDLDPHEAPFAAGVETARALHRLLVRAEIPSVCKTSGKRGLHIYIPLGARYEYDIVRSFAELLATLLARQLPESTSLERDPQRRRGKVYLDFLQNRQAQTVVSAYSVRPVAGAQISTPLHWSEVTRRLNPGRFTMRTLFKRLDKLGDLWQPVLGPGIDLQRILNQLQASV